VSRFFALALLVAVPAQAGANLTPSPELEAKLASLEERRDAIESRRTHAWQLRLSAGIGYALCAATVAWAIVEVIVMSKVPIVPLGGVPSVPISPTALSIIAGGIGAAAIALHVVAGVLDSSANAEEEALDDDERPVRKDLSQSRDAVPDPAVRPTADSP
jgi:hypothetical protein